MSCENQGNGTVQEPDLYQEECLSPQKTKEILCEDFTDIKHHLVFAKRPHTIENLNFFFETRCFPKGREDEKDILEYLGLRQYNPLDIVRKTHGAMYRDFCWIRFEGETLQWKDVNVRADW